MKGFVILVLCIMVSANARPLTGVEEDSNDGDEFIIVDGVKQKNVIDTPIVCPPGKKPDQNGICRDVFSIDVINVIDGPIVCPPGYKPDENGKCREVFVKPDGTEEFIEREIIVTGCPQNQLVDPNGKCRDVFRIDA